MKISQITSFKRGFFEEIHINSHKPKSFLMLVEDAHKDSAADRRDIFPLRPGARARGDRPASKLVPGFTDRHFTFQ